MVTSSSAENSSQTESPQPKEETSLGGMRANARKISHAMKTGGLANCRDLLLREDAFLSPCQVCGKCDLFIHALCHSEEIAFHLLQRGYKVNGFQGPQHHGYRRTALHMCAESGYTRLLNAILDKQPELLFLDTEVHPVHLAVLNHQNDCLKIMLDRSAACWSSIRVEPFKSGLGHQTVADDGVSANHREDCTRVKWLESPDLLIVTLRCHQRISSEILTRKPRKLRLGHVCQDGPLLPLHCAAHADNTTAAQLLLGAGAMVGHIPFGGSDSALCIAIKQKSVGVAEILLEHDASLYHYDSWGRCGIVLLACYCPDMFLRHRGSFDVDVHPSLWGETCMFQVATYPDNQALLALSDIIRHEGGLCDTSIRRVSARQFVFRRNGQAANTFLLNAEMDLEVWDENCGSVLNTPGWNCDVATLKLLLRKIGHEKTKRLLNLKATQSSATLYDAALMGQQEVARTVLRFGANVNADSGKLGTPLMAAAAYGRLCIVKDLIDAGAALSCFSIEENRVRSAIDLAKHFPEIQRWLLVGRWTERRRITYEA
jgi:ankyrin repeat protein